MEVAEQLSEMLTDIFNSSLESGQVQEDWGVANVTPLFKKGSREELGNYYNAILEIIHLVPLLTLS